MRNTNILRKSTLDKIYKIIQDSILNQDSNIIQIEGIPGIGKSTLLSQIPEYLSYKGIFPQIYQDHCHNEFSLKQSINTFQSQSKIPSPLKNDELIKSIFSLRDRRKDILLIILDDAHELNNKDYSEIIELFTNQIRNFRVIIILCGRPGFASNNIIKLKPFTTDECKLFLGHD